jgi:hypothetical protein
MNKIFPLLFAIVLAAPASAQHVSIGANAGMELWLNRQSNLQPKQVFASGAKLSLRYYSAGKWSIAASLSVHGRYDEHSDTMISFDGKNVETYDQYHTRLYAASLMLQRRVLSDKSQKVEHLVGLIAGCAIFDPGLTEHVTLGSLTGGKPETYTNHGKALPLRVWNGFAYELHYHFRPRFEAIFSATAEADVWHLFLSVPDAWYDAPYSRFSSSIGLAYTLR